MCGIFDWQKCVELHLRAGTLPEIFIITLQVKFEPEQNLQGTQQHHITRRHFKLIYGPNGKLLHGNI